MNFTNPTHVVTCEETIQQRFAGDIDVETLSIMLNWQLENKNKQYGVAASGLYLKTTV